jgi:chromosome segregation ATPase
MNSVHHASLPERMDYLEKTLGDSADKHWREIEKLKEGHSRIDQAHGKHAAALEAIKSSGVHSSTVGERLNYLEKVVGDSADKHWEEIQKLKDAHAKSADAMNKAARDAQGINEKHASVAERLQYMERLLGDSADRHATELRALKDSHDRHVQDVASMKAAHLHHASMPERIAYLEKKMGDSADRHEREIADLQAKHAQIQAPGSSQEDRIRYIEKLLGDSADKHARELARLKDAHEKHADDMASMKGSMVHHATMGERMQFLEKAVGDSADKHWQEIQRLKESHAKMDSAHGKHRDDLDQLKAVQQQHATIAERVTYIERQINDSADKHAEAMRKLDAAHGKIDGHKSSLEQSLKQQSEQHNATVQERVAYLEQLIGDNADKHARELLMNKEAHIKLANDTKNQLAIHGTLGDRIGMLEGQLREAASSLANEVKSTSAKVEFVHGKMTEVKRAWDVDPSRFR